MRLLDAIREAFRRLADHIAVQRRLSRFTCGDCERHDRCGKLPSENCIARVAQIARDGDRSRPRPRLYSATPY